MDHTPPLSRIRSLVKRCQKETCPCLREMCELAAVISEAEVLLLIRMEQDSEDQDVITGQVDQLAQLRRDVCPIYVPKADTATGTDPLFFEFNSVVAK